MGTTHYRTVKSIRLVGAPEHHLGFVLDTNGVSWRLRAFHRKFGQPVSESSWFNYPSLKQGEEGFDEKVAEAKKNGWREPDLTS